jgi:hypothetical protein
MNEWKELKIDDLPPDILVGKYEFKLDGEEIGFVYPRDRANIFDNLIRNDGKYRYRKPEPEAPEVCDRQFIIDTVNFAIKSREIIIPPEAE